MNSFKKMIPYLMVNAFVFYFVPMIIQDTGSAMFVLLIVFPISSLIIPLIYGIKHSFNWLYGLLVMLIFAPTIFIFYNESAVFYIVVYGIISFVGNFVGAKYCKFNV